MEEIKNVEPIELKKVEVKKAEPRKVRVTGVGYENSDGSGAQTTYKVNYEVTLIDEVKGAKYPYLVEYRDNKRYFKDITEQ